MAISGLLALLDDMASAADDVAKMAALATQKSAGVVVDDMAVTAGGMAGMAQERETAFVLRVARGSLKNKLVFLVPGALTLDALWPAAMPVLLMGGGAFLAFEAVEKLLPHGHGHAHTTPAEALTPAALLALEEARVAQAIQTDLVLSAEIVAIGLAAMETTHGFAARAAALTASAVGMTVGVYGTVLFLVKIDNMGMWLRDLGGRRGRPRWQAWGQRLVAAAPGIFRVLGVVGTGAMLLVGGGLLTHGAEKWEPAAHAHHAVLAALQPVPLAGSLVDAAVALVTGLVVVAGVAAWRKVRGGRGEHG